MRHPGPFVEPVGHRPAGRAGQLDQRRGPVDASRCSGSSRPSTTSSPLSARWRPTSTWPRSRTLSPSGTVNLLTRPGVAPPAARVGRPRARRGPGQQARRSVGRLPLLVLDLAVQRGALHVDDREPAGPASAEATRPARPAAPSRRAPASSVRGTRRRTRRRRGRSAICWMVAVPARDEGHEDADHDQGRRRDHPRRGLEAPVHRLAAASPEWT